MNYKESQGWLKKGLGVMRPVEPNEHQRVKDKRRAQLEKDIQDYLQRGGVIQVLPPKKKRSNREE